MTVKHSLRLTPPFFLDNLTVVKKVHQNRSRAKCTNGDDI